MMTFDVKGLMNTIHQAQRDMSAATDRLALDKLLVDRRIESYVQCVDSLRKALAYTASLLTRRLEGDYIRLIDIREYALDVIGMTKEEAMSSTDLEGDEEE